MFFLPLKKKLDNRILKQDSCERLTSACIQSNNMTTIVSNGNQLIINLKSRVSWFYLQIPNKK